MAKMSKSDGFADGLRHTQKMYVTNHIKIMFENFEVNSAVA